VGRKTKLKKRGGENKRGIASVGGMGGKKAKVKIGGEYG
jgi:hypothetical protein